MRNGSFADASARATAGEPLDVYDNRVRLWAFLAASVVFGAVGVESYQHGDPIGGALTAVFFFAVGFAIAWRLIISSTPTLRCDAEGVTMRRTGRPPLRIAWRDLRSAYLGSIRNQTFVCLLPRDPAGVLAAAPAATRTVMRANIALVGAPYALPTALTLTAHDLLHIVYTYAPALSAETPDR